MDKLLEEAIIKTLIYRDLFDYPLTAGELHRVLIQRSSTQEAIERVLGGMVGRRKIEEKGGYYLLSGRGRIVRLRRKRRDISREKFKRARRYAGFLHPIPWVKAVFVTGAIAIGNADEKSDLDLLIITSPRRLWLTRFLAFVIFSLLGVKRKPGTSRAPDKICPNMFLSEMFLAIPKEERNLYAAHEVVQARLVWERDSIHRRFLAENQWIAQFLPNVKLPPEPGEYCPEDRLSFIDRLETLAYKAQLKYMEKRRTREVVTPERILFHPIDLAAEIIPRFEKQVREFSQFSLDKTE